MYFVYGRKYYSDLVSSAVSDEELVLVDNMYRHKFWGNVDKETWEENEKSTSGEGCIKCKYTLKDGTDIHLIRTPDTRHVFFVTNQDIKDNFIDNHLQQLAAERERNVRGRRSSPPRQNDYGTLNWSLIGDRLSTSAEFVLPLRDRELTLADIDDGANTIFITDDGQRQGENTVAAPHREPSHSTTPESVARSYLSSYIGNQHNIRNRNG